MKATRKLTSDLLSANEIKQPVDGLAVAHAKPSSARPVDTEALSVLLTSYVGSTVGQRFFGPGWINDDGIACIVLISHDDVTSRRVRADRKCGLVAWRWNNSPSTILSLSLMLADGHKRPHVRWMRASQDPVVLAIRREGRFYVTVANAKGQHSGWLEARFNGGDDSSTTSLVALEQLWRFPTPGIPYSSIHHRFDPLRKNSFNEESVDEIPLWADDIADRWCTLHYKGPWDLDLLAMDRVTIAWAHQAWLNRGRAAGFIQLIIERQRTDGVSPLVDCTGRWLANDRVADRAREVVRRAPLLGLWLSTIAGPSPSAKGAYDAAFAVLHDGYSIFCALEKLFELLIEFGDWELNEAFSATFEAALVDHRITDCGRRRPWLASSTGFTLELKTALIDLSAPLNDIENLWRTGLKIIDILDMGLRIGPSDFPAPLDVICDQLDKIVVEGSIDEAEDKIQTLLLEAQKARQWSIPWGARVEVHFGPFVALRIFELDGEFSCHFLDDQERYFHVAIGLRNSPPQAATTQLIRLRDDDAQPIWNLDAEVSLKLIAAAIVRDFVVVEERESLFTTRPMKRRIRGRNIHTIIYLPRVRYSTPSLQRIGSGEIEQGRQKHHVLAHLRRAGSPSAAQRFLAQRYGMSLPEGFTFVRPHERGTEGDEARVRVYRSRSASKMIFNEVAKAPEGARPAWFDFEKDCAKLLISRDMHVIHQSARRDGDGGVDLYVVDRSGQSWVVQCKCWASHRVVGPDVIRELEGAISLADKGAIVRSKGMVITTSTFSSGAVLDANSLGFDLIDGPLLVGMISGTTK
jgi:hypothetical protein